MSKEEKPRRWNPFAPAPKITEAEKRLQRIEEMRHDLFAAKAPAMDKTSQKGMKQSKESSKKENSDPAEYALNTLLAMLWVETETGRLAVACALSNSTPQLGKAEAPVFAVQLCAQLHALPTDPLAIPSLSLSDTSQSLNRRQWATQAVSTILNDTLTTIRHLLWQEPSAVDKREADREFGREAKIETSLPSSGRSHFRQINLQENESLYRETDACRDALRLGLQLRSPALVETTLRLLRLFTLDFVRESGPLGHQTPELRARASQLLAGLSPDDLSPFWAALNGPESDARRDLLSVLDYLHDPRAVPYLVKLLERHTQRSDGEMIGWASTRALQRFGDRRALPVLRRLAGTEISIHLASSVSPELARAARNAIEAIEHGRASPERSFLLRPSQANTRDLLLPTSDVPDPANDAEELLRTDISEPE